MRPAGQHCGQGNRSVGDILGPIIGNVAHGDSPSAGRYAVHIVETDAASHNQLAMFQPSDRRSANGQEVIHHDARGILDPALQPTLPLCTERADIGNIAQDTFLYREIIGDEICD
jgi:hypothetical protein